MSVDDRSTFPMSLSTETGEQREIGSIIIAFYGPIISMTRKHFIPNTLDGIEPWIFTKFQVLLWVILKKHFTWTHHQRNTGIGGRTIF